MKLLIWRKKMDPRMMGAMALDSSPDQYLEGSPSDPIRIVGGEGQVVEADPEALAAEGMAFAANYMARNGLARPNHNLFGAQTMTKSQLEEQRMNEKQGYPSNLDEATRVKSLEGRVNEMSSGINAILQHLQNGPSSPVSTQPPAVTGGNPAPPGGNPIPTPAPSVIAKRLNPPLTNSSELSEPANMPTMLRQVTLSDGRKVSVPPTSNRAMSLGPATDSSPVEQTQMDEGGDDGWTDEDVVQQIAVPEELKPDAKVVKTQQLVSEVFDFLKANDIHRFWRRHLSQKVHRHVGYSSWDRSLQVEFDQRFKTFLEDPQFIMSNCRKVLNMEMGHALGVKWVSAFIVCIAGFTAFALCGLDE
jgi:hypothetical protein